MLVRMILLETASTVHVGNSAKPDPLTFAQLLELILTVMIAGMDILILPVDESGSNVVMLNVYDVCSLTTVDNNEMVPLNVDGNAVMVVVPCIFTYPLFRIYTVIGSVVLMDGGAV